MKAAIIGGGAAGCFCAIELRKIAPDAEVTVLEAGRDVLAKVALTGGGRCNLTNSFEDIERLQDVYPRGTRLMQRALKTFSSADTCTWFESAGVPLVLLTDHCVFPKSQNAMDIVRTLKSGMRQSGVTVKCNARVTAITPAGEQYEVKSSNETKLYDKVIVTVGGAARPDSMDFLAPLNLKYEKPVASLFTFALPGDEIRGLMGIVAEDVTLSIPGTKLSSRGPLLITDWGASGPATLRLSSYAARYLAERSYDSDLSINWTGDYTADEVRQELDACRNGAESKKMVSGTPLFGLQARLWEHLVARAGLRSDIRWAETGSKGINKLAETLANDQRHICGKGRYKDEYVTCGGVSLDNIAINTLEAKEHKGLFFAGEILDIDAITGGFNLQAAWTTGYIAAHSAAENRD